MGQAVEVFFQHFFFVVGYLQEPLVQGVDIIAAEGVAYFVQAEGKCAAAAAGGQNDAGLAGAYFFGIDDLIGGGVFEEAILVDTGGMGEGVGAHNCFVGLDRHAHRVGYKLAHGV